MKTRHAIAIGLTLVLILTLGQLGPPRLIGTGCTNAPLGFTLAREESDISGTCDSIIALWSNLL